MRKRSLSLLIVAACTTPPPDSPAVEAPDAGAITAAPPDAAPPSCADRTEEVVSWPASDARPAPQIAIAGGTIDLTYQYDLDRVRLDDHWLYSMPVSAASLVAAHACVVGARAGTRGPILCIDRDGARGIDPGDRAKPSLAADAGGGLHVAYVGDDGVWYAHRAAGGVWTRPEQVATGEAIDVSIAADSSGAPHLVYTILAGDGTRGLFAVDRAGDGWRTSFLDDDLPAIGARAIAIDGEDHLHVAYRRHERTLVYVERAPGGAWSPARVIAPDVATMDAAIAIGPGGPAVAHVTGSPSQVRVARRDAHGAWTRTIVGAVVPGTTAAIAVDDDDTAHVVFAEPRPDGPAQRLIHASVCAVD
ncbi:MAG TPA: hypothetical protein VL463_21880 [Kofleriaceae bacterium]|nr:hypothetical protein [Kofleriaceae bacterium]